MGEGLYKATMSKASTYDPIRKNCVVQAWQAHESELRGFLLGKMGHADAVVDDLLQEVFVKAIAQGAGFCSLENPRAWLFRVMRNLLVDYYRRQRPETDLPEDLPEDVEARPAVDTLDQCLPQALQALSASDRHVIEQCDLMGMKQETYAEANQLTLPAVKARIQRARKRLKQALEIQCRPNRDEQGRICCLPEREMPIP